VVPGNFLVKRALELIHGYTFNEPLHHFLKREFRLKKQMGARDRRWMREIVYTWFRLGNALAGISDVERLQASFYLVKKDNDDLAKSMLKDHPVFKPETISSSFDDKFPLVASVYPAFKKNAIFPFDDLISPLLNKEEFTKSILVQPKVWLRVKQEKKDLVLKEFEKLKIPFLVSDEFLKSISVEQGTKLEDCESFKNGWFEIQDLSSQRTADFFKPSAGESWYDCCAASGGKSLLLNEILANIKLTVSDNRSSMIENLKERFKKSGIIEYNSFMTDLESSAPLNLRPAGFDGIIADVPCSGSGTWARSPEQIGQFTKEIAENYAVRQKKILSNVYSLLKPGKPLIYITCSVFKTENEEVIDFAKTELGLMVESMELIQGTSYAADTLFVARLINKG
jgi:16S rRNA (cytosine967-C5)-methyltransferase